MKQLLLLLLALSFNHLHAEQTPYRLRIQPDIIATRDSDVKIKITRIYGSERDIQIGGTYLIEGRIKTKHPEVTTLYFGVTAPGNDGAKQTEDYAQSYFPEESNSEFTLALSVANPGQMHLSAYERQPDGKTDWSKPLIRLNLEDIDTK